MTAKTRHKEWLDSLTLSERIAYDRGYGKAWAKKMDESDCIEAGKQAVKSFRAAPF